jgi:glycogen synthase
MKLLIYSHYFAPSLGGVENIVRKLASGLARLPFAGSSGEFEVVVVTQTGRGTFDDSTLPFRVVRKPGFLRLTELIHKSDLVHLAGPALLPLFLARLVHKPVVVEHHGYQTICPSGSLLLQPELDMCPGHYQAGHFGTCFRCVRAELPAVRSAQALILTGLRAWLCKRATNVTVSQHMTMRLSPSLRLQVIHHGVEGPGEQNALEFEKIGRPSRICFAYVGRFVSEKGIPVLLNAARQVMDEGLRFDLLLIGDGPDRQKLQNQIVSNGLASCARITGFLQGAVLDNLMERVHAVVMPSVWEETAGLSAIEQMMRGRLVIASNIGGLAEIVGGAGMLFTPRDVGALASCMKKVIREPELIFRLGTKARQRALELFGYSRMLEEHAQVYRRLLAAR